MALSLVQQVQLYIGDSTVDAGARPDGRNFSIDEINEFISQGVSLTGSVIVGLITLASEWSAFAVTSSEADVRFDAKDTAKKFRDQADYFKLNPIPLLGTGTRTIPLTRVDAYSDPAI